MIAFTDMVNNKYYWMSNNHTMNGIKIKNYHDEGYTSVTVALLATSLKYQKDRKKMLNMDVKHAKVYYYNNKLEKESSFDKMSMMYILLVEKFKIKQYKKMLLATGNEPIVYVNEFDLKLGVHKDGGRNLLGEMLMNIRNTLR